MENERWFPGEVKLADGTEVEGDLNYNFVSQVLRLRRANEVEVINPEQTVYYTLRQSESEILTYYSLPYRDMELGRERFVFFQVIHEARGFSDKYHAEPGTDVKLEYDESKLKESSTEKKVKKYKILNKSLLSEILRSGYYEIKDYINDRDIALNTVEGFLEVMDLHLEIGKN